jgi:hypothetical protein
LGPQRVGMRRGPALASFHSPHPGDFTPAERKVIGRCRTPRQVQEYLRKLPYNWKKRTLRTFRQVVRHGSAHCLEAALTAATIMEQHGYPPLLLDLESQDNLDHVLFLFQRQGRWGTVAKSRDAGLHGRKPVFRSIRDLVMSYIEPYVDFSGRITGYGVTNLKELLPRCNWRLSKKNVWVVEGALIHMPHRKIKTSTTRFRRALKRYVAFKRRFPHRQATYYRNRHQWL